MSDELVREPEPNQHGTGISIDLVTMTACTFEDLLFSQTVVRGEESPHRGPIETSTVSISPQLSYWHDSESRGMVRLRVTVEPNVQPTWRAMVEVVGQYTCEKDSVLPIDRFVTSNGIAYLVPYIRERLTSLTGASVHGAFLLPPIGVADLKRMAAGSADEAQPESGHPGR